MDAKSAILKSIGADESKANGFRILRESLDSRFSRSKGIFYEFSACFGYEGAFLSKRVSPYEEPSSIPAPPARLSFRPLIVGTGPAGLFCALRLVERGIKPLLLEQGKNLKDRALDVGRFFETGSLLTRSNVHFGFGGAGMFSDAKLTSRSKSPYSAYVLSRLIEFGAKPEIAYQAKPHLGTDGIRKILEGIEAHLLANGASIQYEAEATDLLLHEGKAQGIVLGGREEILSPCVALACGNAARGLFAALLEKGVRMQAKPFAVGVRAEHRQEVFNRYIYAQHAANPFLPPAEYSLTYQDAASGRGVYTFCNCPGGEVVNASSEQGGLAVNGMSDARRSSKNANAAFVVTVTPSDMGGTAEGAVAFQREIEQRAFQAAGGGHCVPTMPLASFLGIKASEPCEATARPRTAEAELADILPSFALNPLRNAMLHCASRIKGFETGILSAPETRTSSPVRILRSDASMESVSTRGLYPIGEGAGYAGGIVSSAIDGIRAADAICGTL
jgi:uncharacterized FAD-dependent dehydrogenase